MKNQVSHALRTVGGIILGSVIFALSFCWLFQPNEIVMGGFTGVAQVLNHLIPAIPIGLTVIVLNIPLFIIAAKLQGLKLILGSLSAMTLGSLLVDLMSSVFTFQPMENTLLASVFGGVLLGVSMGVELKVGATTGGTELAARLLKYKFHHIQIGKLCMGLDLAIIVLYALVFQDVNDVLYGIIAMYISCITMDTVIYGGARAQMAYIISGKSREISEKLLTLSFGVTRLEGQGAYRNGKTEVLLTTFRQQQITVLKETVTAIDPGAFIIVSDAHEVIGEGFHYYSPDEL